MKILIIGLGRIGCYLAFHLLKTRKVSELFLLGTNKEKSDGIISDLREAFPKSKITPVYDASDIGRVSLTFFAFSTLKWNKSINLNDREIEAIPNLKFVSTLSKTIDGRKLGTVVVISNPVDILTRFTYNTLTKNVVGFGISLDEVRIAMAVNKMFRKDYPRVLCVGEHGKNIVPILSHYISGSKIREELYDQVLTESFNHSSMIIKNWGIPLFGPLRQLENLLPVLLGIKSGVVSMSAFLKKTFCGIDNIAMGVPLVFEKGKLKGIEQKKVSTIEQEMLVEAAKKIDRSYSDIITALARGQEKFQQND